MLKFLALIVLGLSLAGCEHLSIRPTQNLRINVSPEKFQCLGTVDRPSGDPILESKVARYIASLENSNKDCKTRLQELEAVINCYNDKNCKPEKLIREQAVDRNKVPG